MTHTRYLSCRRSPPGHIDHRLGQVAGILKLYIRCLPEPLLTYALYDEWIKLCGTTLPPKIVPVPVNCTLHSQIWSSLSRYRGHESCWAGCRPPTAPSPSTTPSLSLSLTIPPLLVFPLCLFMFLSLSSGACGCWPHAGTSSSSWRSWTRTVAPTR
jgi:hypothetical protein